MGRICRANERRQQRGSEVTGDDGNKKRAGRQRPRGRSTSADKEANDMSETHQKKAKGARGGRAAGVKLLLLYTGVAGILWLTVTRHAGPASGESLNAVAGSKTHAADEDRFTVAIYNIHSGKGSDGRRDLNRTAEMLKGVDFAGLNEVAGPTLFAPNQAETLGEKLDMPWLYAPTEILWGRPDFGSAVLSRLPIDGWMRIPLASIGLQPRRNVVLLKVAHSRGTVNVLVTHIARDSRDPSQLEAVIDLFLALDEPAILMGDLNNNSDNPVLRAFLDRPDVETAVDADYMLRGRKLIDWIIYRGLKCVGSEVLPPGVSDHPLVRAEFAWPDTMTACERTEAMYARAPSDHETTAD
jgi:endonuclease/exonuclease/phosphatase family metal-dependent hydrolase